MFIRVIVFKGLVVIVMWASPSSVRMELGLTAAEVDDQVLAYYINRAQSVLRDQISVYVLDDRLIGDVNGVNTTFSLRYYPVADSNYDLRVDKDDVTVYKWGKYGVLSTRVNIEVAELYGDYGIIVLAEPPAGTVDALTASYYYYPDPVDLSHIPRACALLAAYYYVRSEMLLIPESWAHGAYRFSRGNPAEVLWREYQYELQLLCKRLSRSIQGPELSFDRGDRL